MQSFAASVFRRSYRSIGFGSVISFNKRFSSHYYNYNSSHSDTFHSFKHIFGLSLLSLSFLTTNKFSNCLSNEQNNDGDLCTIPGEFKSSLPSYSLQDVKEHNCKDKGIWVIYKRGVYDITEFIENHPGGFKRIIMAAGGSIEPFWNMYTIHKKPEIYEILEELRIGNLNVEGALQISREPKKDVDSMWANEPIRNPIFSINSQRPFNAEPPRLLLVDHFLTPNELFFVRNHLPVPKIDPNSYTLQINGTGLESSMQLSLEDIKTKFPKHTVTSTIQCAGNRRSEMNKVQQVKGLNWESTAISNATWSGAKLVDVLNYIGYNHKTSGALHIHFEGLDKDMVQAYGASIPIKKALDEYGDVILAYEMNGEEIPRDHGYPIRAIIPGTVGARNVKWVGKITLSHEESPSHWQQNDYKGFCPSVTWDTVDFKSAPSIQELPVQSAICDPLPNSVITEDDFTIRGYATSGGGRKIIRVDVSIDGGKTWKAATLKDNNQPMDQAWGWTLWEFDVEVPPSLKGQPIEICCKAIDASYNSQPENFEGIWNLRGVLANAWHRVPVQISNDE